MHYKYDYYMACVCALIMIHSIIDANITAAGGWCCAMIANLTIAYLKKYFDK